MVSSRRLNTSQSPLLTSCRMGESPLDLTSTESVYLLGQVPWKHLTDQSRNPFMKDQTELESDEWVLLI